VLGHAGGCSPQVRPQGFSGFRLVRGALEGRKGAGGARDAGKMIGLLFSEAILFVAAGLVGFGIGWQLYVMNAAQRRDADAREIEQLRTALTEAQVRRARAP
jgi:hypothetical protein